jgi:DNA adenine methylase
VTIKRSPLRYHGGKFRIAPWIISFFPNHSRYVEAFGGAGGVLLQKPRAKEEIYNDIDSAVVNFFRVLRCPESRARLVEMLRLTPFSREEHTAAYDLTADPVESARRLAIRGMMSFGSEGATRKCRNGFRASGWERLNGYPEAVAAAGKRFEGVLIENMDAIKLLQKHDSPETLIYLDPPYIGETRSQECAGRSYRHEMTNADHARLLEEVRGLKGMVVLSGYDNEMYRDTLPDWETYQLNTTAAGNRGSTARTETVWLSPTCQEKRKARLI